MKDIDWQQSCHARYAEVEVEGGWLRLVDDGEGCEVTRYDTDKRQVGEPEVMTVEEAAALA